MNCITERRSVVGIDVTTKGLAYIFFENGRLIDWQSMGRGEGKSDLALVDRIVDGCAADIVVIEDFDAEGCRLGSRARSVLRDIARHVRARGLRVRLVARREVTEAWNTRGKRNKQEIASAIAELFPELAPLVPPPRRNFDPEAERMNIFDALTLVLHLFGNPAGIAP
jgi:hypothetical protein